MAIIVEDPAGTPWGCYSVLYYRCMRDGSAVREHGCDTDVSEDRPRRRENVMVENVMVTRELLAAVGGPRSGASSRA